ncbi:MAG: BNR repeat-containing protein [Rhizobium sp.]|nr:BNR repeat-containing protein [Rhizobium sp.]
MKFSRAATLLVYMCTVLSSGARGGDVELIMQPVAISSQGDVSVFATPIDVQNGRVAVAFVTDADARTTPGYLNTVVREGEKVDNVWQWESTTLDTNTLLDPYHTQPSLAFDRNGYIHVAYNMHNLPWQYAISEQPYSVGGFVFHGQTVSKRELDALRLENKTHYPDKGRALIPGNQITYPAFFKDRVGDLFVSYRYAIRPARNWDARSRAEGIARYDTVTRTWISVGGLVGLKSGDVVPYESGASVATAFAYDEGYVPYLVTLAFDGDNAMHAIWTWWDKHSGQTGAVNVLPSYRKIADITKPTAVVGASTDHIPGWSPATRFDTAKSIAIAANGDVLAILEPEGQNRKLIRRDHATGNWGAPVDTPNSASKILVDRDGNEWLFASGLNLFKRISGGDWSRPFRIGQGLCDPRPVYSEAENSFYILAKTCPDRSQAVVYRFPLD